MALVFYSTYCNTKSSDFQQPALDMRQAHFIKKPELFLIWYKKALLVIFCNGQTFSKRLQSLQITANSFENDIWIFCFQFLVGSDCCFFCFFCFCFGNKTLALDPTWSNINSLFWGCRNSQQVLVKQSQFFQFLTILLNLFIIL